MSYTLTDSSESTTIESGTSNWFYGHYLFSQCETMTDSFKKTLIAHSYVHHLSRKEIRGREEPKLLPVVNPLADLRFHAEDLPRVSIGFHIASRLYRTVTAMVRSQSKLIRPVPVP